MKIRVAAAAWKLRRARSDSDYFGHCYDLVSAAHDEGAEVVVLPELHCLELLPIVPDLDERNVAKYLVQYGKPIEDWIDRIANSSGLIIIGGSHFRETETGIRNGCAVGIPGHAIQIQEKNNLTTYEQKMWGLERGQGLARLPKSLGVTVCYDSEFPEASRVLAEAGALVQCVPAFTETRLGFQRVRWSCLARAIENQIYVVHASLVGDIGYEPVSQTYGTSAILTPSIEPFPADAVLRETALGEEGLVVADLDTGLLEHARRFGTVRNWADRSSSQWHLNDAEFASDSPEDGHLNGLGELN